jgi:hypothetical protein
MRDARGVASIAAMRQNWWEIMEVPYADLDDPQSLNLYSYVRNVPTNSARP